MIRLFTSAFQEPDPARKAEFQRALMNNIALDAIDEICLIVEGVVPLPESRKLRKRPAGNRPSYEDFITWANELATDRDIAVIANADIWFDKSILATQHALRGRTCLALARWESNSGRLFDRNDSQDAWVFRGQIHGIHADFPVGVPRCDNRFLFELEQAGYRVLNPARSIRSFHEHAGVRGEYGAAGGNFVEPPYRYLWPHNLWSLPRTIAFNLAHRDRKVEWHFDRRRVATSVPVRAISKLFRRAGR